MQNPVSLKWQLLLNFMEVNIKNTPSHVLISNKIPSHSVKNLQNRDARFLLNSNEIQNLDLVIKQ